MAATSSSPSLLCHSQKQTNNMKLEKEAFSRGMKHVIKNSKIDLSEKLIGAIFSALDRGEDGTVDFEEYVRGMNVFRSDPYSDERYKMVFEGYSITPDYYDRPERDEPILRLDELLAIYQNYSVPPLPLATLKPIVENALNEMTLQTPGQMNFEEFKDAVKNQKILVNKFWLTYKYPRF